MRSRQQAAGSRHPLASLRRERSGERSGAAGSKQHVTRHTSLVTGGLVLLLFAGAFALYARTAAPGLLNGDEGEFQTNIYKLGVSHTGYPLFFLLGKLWTLLLPIGTVATRANLFSAFWGALAVAAIFVFIQFLTRNRWAAVICALLLAVSRVEWSQAVIPRVYTLNSLFVIVVTFLFFLWRVGNDASSRDAFKSSPNEIHRRDDASPVDLTVPVFAFGLSLTNHRTMMWFAPAITFYVLRFISFQPRRLLSLAVAFILPLLLYAYIFWRGESDVGVEFHLKDFGEMILGGNVNRWLRYGPLDWLIRRVSDLYIPLLIEQFTPLGFIAGWLGIVALALDRPPRGWQHALPAREALLFIVLANLGNSAFCVVFWTLDVEKFFIPSYITFLFLVGVGIAVVWDWLAARLAAPRARRIAQGVLVLLFGVATGFLIAQNFERNDWSARTDVAAAWNENLALPLEQNAVIAGPWESLTPLEYAMYVDGRRRDLERWKVIVKKEQLGLVPYGSRQEDIERAVRAGRPVYLTVYPGDTETLGALVDEFRLTRVGELWRVVNLPPADCRLQVADCGPVLSPTLSGAEGAVEGLRTKESPTVFTDREGRSIEWLGYSVFPDRALRAGDFGLLTLFWRAPQTLGARLTISLRVMDPQKRLVYQRDSEPASGRRSTLGWAPHEIIPDDVGFFIPPDALPGKYTLVIVVYNPANGEDLTTPGGALFTLGDLQVAPRP